MRGGYQIIDLKNKNLTDGVGTKYDNVYDAMKGTKKTVLITGMKVNDVEYRDCYVDFTLSGTAYVGTIYGKQIKIENTDVVTITTQG